MSDRVVRFKNKRGTTFSVSIDSKDPEDIKYLHNQVMAPGEQVIDFFTWFHKALNEAKDNYYGR